jgi:hypothetical protein
MLFPENPEKQPELWQSVTEQLGREKMCYVVLNGMGYPDANATVHPNVSAEKVIQRMKNAKICRISATRRKAIAPHFAADLDGETASIIEFVTYPSEGMQTVNVEQLRRDLETAVINLLFGSRGVNTVFVPIVITAWNMKDVEVKSTIDGLMFSKRV